jgi:hypothetical protein
MRADGGRESARPRWETDLPLALYLRAMDASAQMAALKQAREAYARELMAAAEAAARNWQRDRAIAGYERAARVLPGSDEVIAGLKAARRVGQPGYVFRDGDEDAALPQMIVVGTVAFSRTEVTVA